MEKEKKDEAVMGESVYVRLGVPTSQPMVGKRRQAYIGKAICAEAAAQRVAPRRGKGGWGGRSLSSKLVENLNGERDRASPQRNNLPSVAGSKGD